MKRIIAIILTVLLVSAVIFGGCAKPVEETPTTPTEPEVKPIEWRFASFVPPSDVYSQEQEAWGKRLEEATGGRVRITYYWAESLIKIPGLFDAITSGTCDLAMMVPMYTPERLPLSPVTSLPMMFRSSPQAAQTWLALYNKHKVLRDELYPAKALWAQNPGATNISSKRPVQTVEDFKGLKIRTTSKHEIAAYTLLGATPVPVTSGERYHALETGIVDATSDDFNAVWIWRLHEVTKYRTDNINMQYHTTPVVMNSGSYDKLPEDIRQIFDELTDSMEQTKSIAEHFEQFQAGTTEKVKEFDKKVGNPPFYVLPEAERQRWIDIIHPVIEEWASEMEAKGLPGKALVDDMIAIAEQYE